MTYISDYYYYDGTKRVDLETLFPINRPCLMCHGWGYLDEDLSADDDEDDEDSPTCPICGGEGEEDVFFVTLAEYKRELSERQEEDPEMMELIKCIQHQRDLLKRRYGKWQKAGKALDYWE